MAQNAAERFSYAEICLPPTPEAHALASPMNWTEQFLGLSRRRSGHLGHRAQQICLWSATPPVQHAAPASPRKEFTVVADKLKKIFKERENQSRREAATEAFDVLRRIIQVTRSLFGDPVTIHDDYDPEFPEDKFVVFSVAVRDIDAGVRLENEWVQRVRSESVLWESFRLSIHVAE